MQSRGRDEARDAARSEGGISPRHMPGTGFGDGLTRAERSAERKRVMPPPPPQRDLQQSYDTPQPQVDEGALAAFDERLQMLEEKVTTGFAGLTRSLAVLQLDGVGGGMGGGASAVPAADGGGPPKNVYDGEGGGKRAACARWSSPPMTSHLVPTLATPPPPDLLALVQGGEAEEENSDVDPVQMGDIVYLKDSGSFGTPANLCADGALKRCCVHEPTAAHQEVSPYCST